MNTIHNNTHYTYVKESIRDDIIDRIELMEAALSLLGYRQPDVTRDLLPVIKKLRETVGELTEEDIQRVTTDAYLEYKWARAKSLAAIVD